MIRRTCRTAAPNGPQPRRSYGEAAECASLFRPTPAAIQYAELDPGPVDPAPHDPVERIDLAHKVPLAEPADRRVARHLADRRPLVRQQQGARAEPSGRRRFAPRMPAADHDDVARLDGVTHGAVIYSRDATMSSVSLETSGQTNARLMAHQD
jgi:hypothetical protein